jgi:hypothetical protein
MLGALKAIFNPCAEEWKPSIQNPEKLDYFQKLDGIAKHSPQKHKDGSNEMEKTSQSSKFDASKPSVRREFSQDRKAKSDCSGS